MKKQLLCILVLCFSSLLSYSQELMVKGSEKGLYLDHTVASKEGLYSIGRLYNVNPKTIAAYNKIELNKGLEIGQNIRIPLNDTNFTQKNSKGVPVYYLPAPGEGLMKVSNVNRKVTLANLRSWNNLSGDNIRAGEKLVVGYLVSKDYKAPAAQPKPELDVNDAPVRTDQPIGKPETVKPDVKQPETATSGTSRPETTTSSSAAETVKQETNNTPRQETVKPEIKTEPAKTEHRNETVKEPKQETIISETKPGITKPVAVDRPVPDPVNAAPDEIKLSSEDGFFKSFFDQQVKVSPVSKNNTVTSGIFKTSSGWQDSKYYLLMDGVATGTIVRLVNPDNNKAVYAKVLGEMNGIRQNQGLGIRISNAAASALGIREEEKFIVRVNY